MIEVSKKEWEKIPTDYRGIWHDYYGDKPEWKGKAVVMSTCLTHNPAALYRFMINNGGKFNGVLLGTYSKSYTVIGNIHDNPEFLKGGE